MEKNIDIQVQFRAIELLEHSLIMATEIQGPIRTFTFDINTEIQVNDENKLAINIITIAIFNEDKSVKLGSFRASNIFFVENYNKVVMRDIKGNAILNDQLVSFITQASLATTRGLMWATFKGTFLHEAILPLIETKQLMFK